MNYVDSEKDNEQTLLLAGWTTTSPNLDLFKVAIALKNDTIRDSVLSAIGEAGDYLTQSGKNPFLQALKFYSEDKFDQLARTTLKVLDNNDLPNKLEYPNKFGVRIVEEKNKEECNSGFGGGFYKARLAQLDRIVNLLGKPDKIYQCYNGITWTFNCDDYTGYNNLLRYGSLRIYWHQHETWLTIQNGIKDSYSSDLEHDDNIEIELISKSETPYLVKSIQGLAVRVESESSIVDFVSQYGIEDFTVDVQDFSSRCLEAIKDPINKKVAVSAYGYTGTGKTRWAMAMAQLLQRQGYLVMEVDLYELGSYEPSTFYDKVVLIINESDNITQKRTSSTKHQIAHTQRILTLLDGSGAKGFVNIGTDNNKLVILQTANSNDMQDEAYLRQGRNDLTHLFTHRYDTISDVFTNTIVGA
jgi:ATPase family associated with various cellular activities (AAA)